MSKILPAILGAAMSSGGGSSSQVQSDWNENNTTSEAYIQNRPFYEEVDDDIHTLSMPEFYDTFEAGTHTAYDFYVEYEEYSEECLERFNLLSSLYNEGYDGINKTLIIRYGNHDIEAGIQKSINENQSIQFNIYKVGEDYDDFWDGLSEAGIFYENFSQETSEYRYEDFAVYDTIYDENITEFSIVIPSSTIYKLDNKFIDTAESIGDTNKIATAGLVQEISEKLWVIRLEHSFLEGQISSDDYDKFIPFVSYMYKKARGDNRFIYRPLVYIYSARDSSGSLDTYVPMICNVSEVYSIIGNQIQFSLNATNVDSTNNSFIRSSINLTGFITDGEITSVSLSYTRDLRTIVGTGNEQTITGKKTFSVLPESSVTPTTDNQLVNKKYVDENAGGALVITSSASTVVEGKAVPKITNTQLTSIYNAIVTDGKTVYIEDSDSEQRFEVTGAETDGTNIFAYMVFAESLVLTYQDSTGTDATITGKAIGGGSSKTIDDTHIPIYYAGEIYFNTNSNPWNISKTSEDGIKILNKINEAYHNNDLIFYLQVNNTNFDLPYRNIKILIKLNPTGASYENFVPKEYQLYTDISSSNCRRDSVGLPGRGRWQLDENDNWTTTEYYILSRSHTIYNFAKGDVIKYVYSSNSTTTIGTDVIPTISDTDISTLYDRFTSTSTKYDCYVQDSLDFTTSRVLEASLISGAKSISFIFAHRLLLTYTVGATPEVLHLGGTQ